MHSLHPRIAAQLQHVYTQGPLQWMTTGRTVLIMKDVLKGPIPSNFRPITCLPTLWKLLSSILAGDLYCHLSREGLLPCEQKCCTKGS